MRRIVLASSNSGKVRELNDLMVGLGVELVAQSDFGVASVEETGHTFVENAILKARHASRFTGLPAIADDSGLVVDALAGDPGIYSARYAGPGASDARNVEKLLRALIDKREIERSARFECVIVLLHHADDPVPIICRGTWHGSIAQQPSGNHGFGYDPIFFVADHDCCAAELEPSTKNAISHRARAMRQLRTELQSLRAAGAGV